MRSAEIEAGEWGQERKKGRFSQGGEKKNNLVLIHHVKGFLNTEKKEKTGKVGHGKKNPKEEEDVGEKIVGADRSKKNAL